ncbi:MAG: ABC transporter ATP-binding protein, partial [Caldilineaceae bacterium]|nr:ABC transporter ATP-binding protein [Caldilineaceae bacterium]
AEVAELLEMNDALDRDVDTLDNGTRQKVAVARAVARFPKIILFDEPITNIDINAKLQLKRALKELITRLDQTIIYVTHDQTEAMTLADRIALMKDGSIVQYDEPRTLYNQPNDVFGGWFLGNPGMNFVEHSFDNAGSSLFDRPVTLHGAGASAREITLGIRPEHVQVSNELLPGGVRGRVVDRVIVIGGQYLVTLDVAEKRLKAKVAAHVGAGLQDEVWVALPPERITLFDKDGQKPDATLQFA